MGRREKGLRSLGLLIVSLLSACGAAPVVRQTLTVPADVPVEVFPELVVVPGTAPEDLRLAAAVADAIATQGRTRVHRTTEEGLAHLRPRLGRAAAILRVESSTVESTRSTLVSQPGTFCGGWSCAPMRRTMLVDVPVVTSRARMALFALQDGRLLEELILEERQEGSDPLSLRLRVTTRLGERLAAAVADRRIDVPLDLIDIDDPRVREALAALARGQALEARSALRTIVAEPSFAQRNEEERAKLLFNLAQAERVAVPVVQRASNDDRTLMTAESLLRQAIALDPRPEFSRALGQIEEERRAHRRASAASTARHHNERLGTVPEVPASYR